jgi:hypothetical protein
MKMINDNNTPQEQGAQEEALPLSLDHEELEAAEMESVSGGAPHTYTVRTCGFCPTYACVLI